MLGLNQSENDEIGIFNKVLFGLFNKIDVNVQIYVDTIKVLQLLRKEWKECFGKWSIFAWWFFDGENLK